MKKLYTIEILQVSDLESSFSVIDHVRGLEHISHTKQTEVIKTLDLAYAKTKQSLNLDWNVIDNHTAEETIAMLGMGVLHERAGNE